MRNFRSHKVGLRKRIALLLILTAVIYFLFIYGALYILQAMAGLLHEPLRKGPADPGPYFFSRAFTLHGALALSFLIIGAHLVLHKLRGGDRILKKLSVTSPDTTDLYHKKLAHVVTELSLAAGIKRPRVWVIPELYANALSLRGHICITEGLLSRLNRDELQSVIGHELGHIVIGDIELKTLTSSIMGMWTGLFRILSDASGRMLVAPGSGRSSLNRDVNRGGGPALFWLFMLILIPYTFTASLVFRILNAVLGQRYEYLADVISVELTRHPAALAGALRKVHSDAGGVVSDPALSPCFFLPPSGRSSSSRFSSFFNMLFGSHPPVSRRVEALMSMASTGIEARGPDKAPAGKPTTGTDAAPPALGSQGLYARRDDSWVGPYNMPDLLSKSWVTPGTAILTPSGKTVKAYIFLLPLFEKGSHSDRPCPRCGYGMVKLKYEWTGIDRCTSCGGVILRRRDLARIIVRRDIIFNETETTRGADEIRRLQGKLSRWKRERCEHKRAKPSRPEKIKPDGVTGRPDMGTVPEQIAVLDPTAALECPSCGQAMTRAFYSALYTIPLDTCVNCNLVFFDSGELENLQAAIQKLSAR